MPLYGSYSSGAPAALADKVLANRGANDYTLTVNNILDAAGLLAAITPAALTDKIIAVRGTTAKTLLPADILSALTLLGSLNPPVGTDEMLLDRAAAAGKVTLAQLATYIQGTIAGATHTVGGAGDPAFANGWVNLAGGTQPVTFSKDNAGVVRLRGAAKSGTMALPMFVLPAGFRPLNTVAFAVPSNNLFGELVIDSAGNVTPQVGSNVSFWLEGVTFLTT